MVVTLTVLMKNTRKLVLVQKEIHTSLVEKNYMQSWSRDDCLIQPLNFSTWPVSGHLQNLLLAWFRDNHSLQLTIVSWHQLCACGYGWLDGNAVHVYSVTVMTHAIALESAQSSHDTFEPSIQYTSTTYLTDIQSIFRYLVSSSRRSGRTFALCHEIDRYVTHGNLYSWGVGWENVKLGWDKNKWSAWLSPKVRVMKEDVIPCLWVDYHKLNMGTWKKSFYHFSVSIIMNVSSLPPNNTYIKSRIYVTRYWRVWCIPVTHSNDMNTTQNDQIGITRGKHSVRTHWATCDKPAHWAISHRLIWITRGKHSVWAHWATCDILAHHWLNLVSCDVWAHWARGIGSHLFCIRTGQDRLFGLVLRPTRPNCSTGLRRPAERVVGIISVEIPGAIIAPPLVQTNCIP